MPALAFYGDSEGSEVFAIDISAMSLLCRIPTGLGPYVRVPGRGENSVRVLAVDSGEGHRASFREFFQAEGHITEGDDDGQA